MKKGQDILLKLPGLVIIHHKVPGKELGSHQHAEHEFFLPISGEIKIGFKGEEFIASPGKMLYVPPKIEHTFSSTTMGAGERVIWLISDQLWRKHRGRDFQISVFPQNSLAKELVFYLLLKREVNGEKYFISALIESLLDSLTAAGKNQADLELAHLSGKVEDSRIQKSLMLINTHLSSDSFQKIAASSGMSLRNFNRVFLKETGLTPKQYLQMRRIEKARRLLSSTNHTITDISLEVGFNSVSKFIEAFKKYEGLLPSDFRNQH